VTPYLLELFIRDVYLLCHQQILQALYRSSVPYEFPFKNHITLSLIVTGISLRRGTTPQTGSSNPSRANWVANQD